MDLTPEEHDTLVLKIVSVFEDDMRSQKNQKGPESDPKITFDQLWNFRMVVQAWKQTVFHCAKADLDERGFNEVKAAVETGDALDSQLCACLKSFPLEFGLTMLPDVKCMTDVADVDEAEADDIVERAEKNEWPLGFPFILHCSFVWPPNCNPFLF